MIAFSLICALILWVYVTSTEGDEHTRVFNGVRLIYEGETALRDTKDLVITSRDATSVRVSITGKRRIIAQLDAADLSATIDLSSITSPNGYVSTYKINYPSGIDTSSLQINSMTPETVSYRVDKLSRKTVPVKGVFNGSPAEGFSAEPLEFSPSSVTISGPAASLANVEDAWIEVNRDNVDKTQTFVSDYKLRDADGSFIEDELIVCEDQNVTVTLPVISVKEVKLAVNILPGAGATEDDLKISIEPKSVVIAGDADILAGTNTIYLENIDLADIDESFTETYPIVIPNNTEMLSGQKEATVTIEVKGLAKKTVSITNFSFKNETPGYVPEVMSKSLEVVLRGPQDVLDNISDVNVRAVADLAEFGSATGIVSAPVKIYIDGTTEAGALGEYQIYVNISVDGQENSN